MIEDKNKFIRSRRHIRAMNSVDMNSAALSMTLPDTTRNKERFIFIAGPCVIEDKYKAYDIAAYLKELTAKYPLTFIFKASFYKANRTSLKSFRGPGLNSGIKILENIKKRLNVPMLSDIHCKHQIKYVKDILDVIQIPAFLCRQTDLIVEAAKTKKIINIKKGQFLSPY
ncbi:MAG: hypothetical protein M0R20_05645, partial [Candidatus Omnitrophica bacterium]|nr:hypothetical protein [Candidatus Omnitrophota bacterium]